MKTLDEIISYMTNNYDPYELVEMLQISSVEILDRFEDRVVHYYDQLNEMIELEEEPYDQDYRYPWFVE